MCSKNCVSWVIKKTKGLEIEELAWLEWIWEKFSGELQMNGIEIYNMKWFNN